MSTTDTKAILWKNVQALMQHYYKRENLTRLASETKIGPGTTSRIKKQQTSVGIDVLEAIATRFSLHPWQLLVPGLDPENPPASKPVKARELERYERVMNAAIQIASEAEPTEFDPKKDASPSNPPFH